MATVPRQRLLIVEDEPTLRVAMSDTLRKEGWAVDVADNGEDGQALFEPHKHTLVVLDLVRTVQGGESQLEVVVHSAGHETVPISDRLVPAVVVFVLITSGMFVPAFLIVQERERGTLQAVLVTPVRMSEVLASRALLGFGMTIIMSAATLALNGTLAGDPLAITAALAGSST